MGQMNLWAYAVGSTVLTAAVVTNALQTKEQFYPAMVYLTKSKPCMMVFGNMGIMMTILLGHLVKRMFLGKLRDIEVEHLTDRIKATITDTLLAMTIFRNEFNGQFVVFFTILLFLKIFHWLSQDRVDYIQHTPASNFTLMRIFSLMGMLSVVDALLLYYAASYTYAKGPSMMLLFGFEALLLIFTILSTMVKFIVNVIDSRQQVQWDRKGSFLLHLEFVTDICQFGVYLIFFAIIMAYYGLPLHIIRNVYISFNSIKQSIATLYRYKMATANMNERFPDVSPSEITEDNNLCIVCREEMQSAKKLPCGHILHSHCLLTWLQRQQTCPICRMSVLAPPTYNRPPTQQQPQQPQQPQPHQHQQNQYQPPYPQHYGYNQQQPQQPQQSQHLQPPRVAQPQQYPAYESPSVSLQNTSADGNPGSSMPTYTTTGGLSTEAEILQTLQVLQLQITSLQEQMTHLSEQLHQAGFNGNNNHNRVEERPKGGKGKEKEEAGGEEKEDPTVNNNNNNNLEDDPAEQLRRRRLMRFSNQ